MNKCRDSFFFCCCFCSVHCFLLVSFRCRDFVQGHALSRRKFYMPSHFHTCECVPHKSKISANACPFLLTQIQADFTNFSHRLTYALIAYLEFNSTADLIFWIDLLWQFWRRKKKQNLNEIEQHRDWIERQTIANITGSSFWACNNWLNTFIKRQIIMLLAYCLLEK